jgi:replicative DNA helicase
MSIEKYLEKPLPSDEDAEVVILGSILLNNNLLEDASKILSPRDFYSPRHRTIFGLMVELFQSGTPIDPITIGNLYKSQGHDPATMGGVSSITAMTGGLPHLPHLDEYLKIVRDHAIRRRAIFMNTQMTNDLLRGEAPVEDILGQAETELLGLSTSVHSDRPDEANAFHTLDSSSLTFMRGSPPDARQDSPNSMPCSTVGDSNPVAFTYVLGPRSPVRLLWP